MKKRLPLFLIILGIVFILTPFISEQIIKFHSKSINNQINNETIRVNNQNDQIEAIFDFSAIEDADIGAIIKGSIDFDKEYVIGILIIPDLDINLPIMKGLTNANLMAGAATMKAEQEFGLGNFTLAGHYMESKELLFGSLMDIEIGDMVYISDGVKTYEYSIYDRSILPDTATEMLSDERSDERKRPIISLMTCYFSSSTGKRFFASGELVDEYFIVE